MPKLTPHHQAARQLWRRYPRHDGFVRQVGSVWSAEVVAPGQSRPPYRTLVIAEADTLEELRQHLEQL